MISEIYKLTNDVLGSVRMTAQEGEVIKAALLLAYQVGVRDGYAQCAADIGAVRDEQPA